MPIANYPVATWNPWNQLQVGTAYEVANRGAAQIEYIVIHTTFINGSIQGTAQSNINGTAAGFHYIVEGSSIYQAVADKDISYHADHFYYNQRSIGIEVCAIANVQGTISDAEYRALADLTRWLCDTYGVSPVHVTGNDNAAPDLPALPSGIVGHNQVDFPGSGALPRNPNAYINEDPGQYFDWNYFIGLVQGGTTLPVTFTVAPQSATEGNSLTFRISIQNPKYASVPDYLIYYNTTNGTATAGNDYNGITNKVAVHFTASSPQFVDVSISTLLDSNFNEGTETFNFNVHDFQHVLLKQAQGTITDVPPPNQPPNGVNDSFPAQYGQTISGNVLANDTDPENDARTAVIISEQQTAIGGTVNLLANGALQYKAPSGGTATSDSFSYTVQATGGSDAATVTINLSQPPPPPTNQPPSVRNDFNSDGTSDILWRSSGGQVEIWELSNNQVDAVLPLGARGARWHIAGTGDFDGDGDAGILWRNENGMRNGAVDIWELNGASARADLDVGSRGARWHILGTGDFDGDERTDILWRNENGARNGAVDAWLMDGNHVKGSLYLGVAGADQHFVAAGDFNGDDKADILWRNDAGTVSVWQTNGSQVQIGNRGARWHMEGAGDFDGDGDLDILWRNEDGARDGAVDIWRMNGVQLEAHLNLVGAHAADQRFATIGDFDGDQRAESLWRRENGAVEVLEGNGTFQTILGHAHGSDWTTFG